MSTQNLQIVLTDFAREVRDGLTASPKHLSSKYFYDERGDKLFQQIMHLEEYYLTRSEFEIFQNHKADLLDVCQRIGESFDLIEFGAGDGYKTQVLLEHFVAQGADFRYCPIDISGHALELISNRLHEAVPGLQIDPLQGEYFKAVEALNESETGRPKVLLFLGSNIGNFYAEHAIRFFKHLADLCKPQDQFICGFDLKKDPRKIIRAYDDEAGVTRDFNLNLLNRINNELGGNFNVNAFQHFPTYNPQSGETLSYLVSREDQTVTIEALELTVHFKAWEAVYMELSQKYDPDMIDNLATHSGWKRTGMFRDAASNFAEVVFSKA